MANYEYPLVALPVMRGIEHLPILDILPESLNSEVRLTLRAAPLSQHITYEAVSYTWVARTKGRSVLLDGSYILPVTDNLFRALQRLRRRLQKRTVWIDAFCINQLNLEERAVEVAIIGPIYRTPTYVNVWRGEFEPGTGVTW